MQQNRKVNADDVTFLTSQCCEDTGQVGEQNLVTLGLSVGEFCGNPYPLTNLENCFIGDDTTEIAGHMALIGYSVLIRNRKYLAPAIEIDYGEEHTDTKAKAIKANEQILPILERLADMTGGHFSWEPDEAVEFHEGDGKFVAHLFIPFEYAEEHANGFELWKQHLTDIGNQAMPA